MSNSINILKPSVCFEVQRIIGISTSDGKCRSYQVQWAPSWISGTHLIGCEDLIEQFEYEQDTREVKVEVVNSDVSHNSTGAILAHDVSDVMQEVTDESHNQLQQQPQQDGDNVEGLLHRNMSINMMTIDDDRRLKDGDITSFQFDELISDNIENTVCQNVMNTKTMFVVGDNNDIAHTDLVGNRQIHTGEQPFQCKQCERGFNSSTTLMTHVRTHTGRKAFRCNVCNKEFTTNGYLKVHTRIHTGEKPYKCEVCGKGFTQSTDLKRHVQIHNEERADDKTHKCTYCDKSFYHNSNLMQHIKIHTGEKPFQCTFCDKEFIRSSGLNAHLKIHTEYKPYKCEVCKKGFVESKDLRRHAKVHTGEKPYKCGTCDKSFVEKCNLKYHTRVHTGEKPYKCTLCEKQFIRNSHLTKHLVTHVNMKDENVKS